jgi:tRNA nucleotidyltransferase (CCA-adding enzyme)
MHYNDPMDLVIPEEVSGTHAVLRGAGFESYLVGGCVRDLLLDREPKDWDLTTNARPEQIQALFPDTFYENDFGTVGVVTATENPSLKVIEVTPYRKEGKYTNARHPDEIMWADTLADDLERRDFTVNSIAYDIETRTIVDLHGGREDLKRKVLVTVGDPRARFREDALRMLRAIRLSAELEFALDGGAAAGIVASADQMKKISRERVRDELSRLLLSKNPMQGIFMAQKLGLLRYMIPELEEGIGAAQNQAHSFDVFEHSLRTLQHAADREWSLILRLSALLHDIGKPASRAWSEEKKDWTFYGHEVIGAKIARRVLADLKYPKETIETVTTLVRWHMFFSDPDKITLSAVRRIITRVGTDHIKDLLNLRVCDRIGTGRPKEHPFRLRKYMSMVEEAMRDPISVKMLHIDGYTLMGMGIPAGPRIGWLLHALLEEVLDDPTKNTPEYLKKMAQTLQILGDEALQALGVQGLERREAAEEREISGLRAKYHVT